MGITECSIFAWSRDPLCILCDNCDIQVHTQAILTSLLFCCGAEIRYQDGLDECAVEIGLRWEPEGAGLKLSFGSWDIIQVVQIFLDPGDTSETSILINTQHIPQGNLVIMGL